MLGATSGGSVYSRKSRIWLIAAMAAVFILSLPNLQYPIGRDQATYCVIAESLLKGKHLYRDLWDNKPPGIFYLYVPIVELFGRTTWLLGAADLVCVLAAAFATFCFCTRYLGPQAGTVAAVLYAYWHDRKGYINAAQPEIFIVLLILAAFFLLASEGYFAKWRSFAAGLALGAAFWTKYNALLFLPLVVFLPYLKTSRLDESPPRFALSSPWREWFARAAALLGGLAFAIAAVLVSFRLSGAWPATKEVQFRVLPRYGAMVVERTPHYFLWALGQINVNLGNWPEAGVALALLIAWRCREFHRTAPIFLAAASGLLVTLSQARFNAYTFETFLPFLAMLWAYVAVQVFRGFQALSSRFVRSGWNAARIGVWLVFINCAYFPLPVPAMHQVERYQGFAKWWRSPEDSYAGYWWALGIEHLGGEFQVVRYLKGHSAPGDKVYVWGTAPLIYFLSGRECPSRFVSNLALISDWAPAAWRDELVQTLKLKRPSFIIVERRDAIPAVSGTTLDSQEYLVRYPALDRILSHQYRRSKAFTNFNIYKRQHTPAGGGAW
ncbi:MAG TPA: glycosyltransferase family 39 protein [Terriglobia bacterium]|nr:glycosyltransferase family 39 protein [Terriglobia bacterium]